MHTERTIGRKFARILERGVLAWPAFGARSLVKAIELPTHVRVVGVGGATIGGSGKTPLAIAIVRALVERGRRAAFVAHGYRGRIDRARLVLPSDDPFDVGDETIVAARALHEVAPVVVGPSRGEAIHFAARHAETIVVDHLHQTRPRTLDCAVLAVDEIAPWGSGRPFPFGDLVQRPDALLATADVVVRIGSEDARSRITRDLPCDRVGLITSAARPERIVRALHEVGVVPRVHVERSDHARVDRPECDRIGALAARHGLAHWLVDAKTEVWLGGDAGAPIVPLRHHLQLSPSLVDRLARSC